MIHREEFDGNTRAHQFKSGLFICAILFLTVPSWDRYNFSYPP